MRKSGALVAVLGGLDMLAFTAGVGECSAVLRARICQALGSLGLDIDEEANRAHASTISPDEPRARCARADPRGMMAARHALTRLRGDATTMRASDRTSIEALNQ